MPSKLGQRLYPIGAAIKITVCGTVDMEVDYGHGTSVMSFAVGDLEDLIDQLTEAREVLWANLGRKIEGAGNGLA